MLDGEIGDAAPRIQPYGADDGPVGQAGMHAWQVPQCALAGCIRRQRQVGEDLAEEEARAGVARDEVGVLADPAEPGIARQRLLQHRRAVDAHAVAERPDHAAAMSSASALRARGA